VTPWCAKAGSWSSGVSEVVVEHAAETFAAQDSAALGCGLTRGCGDKLVSDALMVSFDVIVVDIFVEAWCANTGPWSSGVSEVVVEHAAETSTEQDSAANGCRCIGGCSDKLVAEALMVSLSVIVVDVFVKELPEVTLAQRNDAGQAFSSDRADESLCVSVQVRTPRWQPHATHTAGASI
jgi:hypothetical protein